MENKKITVTISTDLVKRIEDELSKKGVPNVEEYILSLLNEKFPTTEQAFTSDEEEKVKERLKALGYMD